MRVALVGPQSAVLMQRWCRALAERGHDVTLVTMHPVPDDHHGYRVLVAAGQGPVRTVNAVRILRDLVTEWRPDVVNVHDVSRYGIVGTLARPRTPTLLTVWSGDVTDPANLSLTQRRLVARSIRRATHIASTSRATAARTQELYPLRGSISAIPVESDYDLDAKKAHPIEDPRPGRNGVGGRDFARSAHDLAHCVDLMLDAYERTIDLATKTQRARLTHAGPATSETSGTCGTPGTHGGSGEHLAVPSVVHAGLVCVLYGSADVPGIVVDFARTAPAVVVDNSGDLHRSAPGVGVIRPGRNLGYSAGVNAGLAALPVGLDAVLVVNPDIVGDVEALHDLAAAAAQFGTPVMAAPTGGHGSFGFLPRASAPLVIGHYLLRSGWHPTPRRPDQRFLSGALLAFNAAALQILAPRGELLRPDLFFMDDVDVSDRAQANGVSVVEIPIRGRLVHEGGTSMRRRPAVRIYFSRVSKVRYWEGRSSFWGAVLRRFFVAETAIGEVVARRRERDAADGSATMGFELAREWLRTGALELDERVLGNTATPPPLPVAEAHP